MKTMMLADFLALAKSLPKNVALWALLATGICLAAGNATPIILLTGFPMSHMVLMPMLLRDQRRDWVAFRQALPLSRANVVAGRYASIASSSPDASLSASQRIRPLASSTPLCRGFRLSAISP